MAANMWQQAPEGPHLGLRLAVADGPERAHIVAGGVGAVGLPAVDGYHDPLVPERLRLRSPSACSCVNKQFSSFFLYSYLLEARLSAIISACAPRRLAGVRAEESARAQRLVQRTMHDQNVCQCVCQCVSSCSQNPTDGKALLGAAWQGLCKLCKCKV